MDKSLRFIGIDPSMRLNGLGMAMICDGMVHTTRYRSLAIFAKDVLSWSPDNCFVVVEDSSLQNITFRRHTNNVSKISRNVGMNQAASRFIIDWLAMHDFDVTGISPQDKGKKWLPEYGLKVMEGFGLKMSNKRWTQDEVDAFQLSLISKHRYEQRNKLRDVHFA